MTNTSFSLDLTRKISESINNQTFHHHYHILYDIAQSYPSDLLINYVEIGCYAGGSACLMLQRKNTRVISIDLGVPISPETVLNNTSKHNPHNNCYKYIQGNSHSLDTVKELTSILTEIDILFIDGDHKYSAVKKDFELYSKFVKKGGYIVFDDYNDSKYSPEVKVAVDEIVKVINSKYKVIGTLKNSFGARPSDLVEGNCFLLQKR